MNDFLLDGIARPVERDVSAAYYIRSGSRAGVLKIGGAAIRTLREFRQESGDATEAGGVLIGRHLIDSSDIVVDRVTTPMRGDRRSRFAFHRAKRAHQRELDREWEESGGTSVYLGEWHTHPEAEPAPSVIDFTDWKLRLRRDRLDADFAFFIIVGLSQIAVWEGSRASHDIARLTPRAARNDFDSNLECMHVRIDSRRPSRP